MITSHKIPFLFVLGLFFMSCGDLPKDVPVENRVARVNDTYLYKSEISELVSSTISDEDSALIVSNYIKNWVVERVLLDRAKINLPDETQKKFKKLAKDYKEKLFIKAYKNALVSKNLDTTISSKKIKKFYSQNKEMFKLNENLVKLRYLYVNDSLLDLDEVKERFRRFNKEDVTHLLDKGLQFNSYSFNDSVWVSILKVRKQIPSLQKEENKSLLKKSNFMQLHDSLGVYLIFVKDVLRRKQQAPLNYVKPTIKQILLYKQKLELAKELERAITDDAFKNEQVEIYH